MTNQIEEIGETRGLGFFEKYLYVWVILCILAGIVLNRAFFLLDFVELFLERD